MGDQRRNLFLFDGDEVVTESYCPFIIFKVIMTINKLKTKIVHVKYTDFDIKYLYVD